MAMFVVYGKGNGQFVIEEEIEAVDRKDAEAIFKLRYPKVKRAGAFRVKDKGE